MKRRMRSKRSTAGFTLLELLVIVVIIGVLFAIASPGWDAILSRQRVNSAREQVMQVIRTTQTQARSTRSSRMVVFDRNPGGIPRVASLAYQSSQVTSLSPVTLPSGFNQWQVLGNGTIDAGVIDMRVAGSAAGVNAIVFDSNGAVAVRGLPSGVSNQLGTLSTGRTGFAVTIARANVSGNGTNRCILIETLLGAMRQEETSNCP